MQLASTNLIFLLEDLYWDNWIFPQSVEITDLILFWKKCMEAMLNLIWPHFLDLITLSICNFLAFWFHRLMCHKKIYKCSQITHFGQIWPISCYKWKGWSVLKIRNKKAFPKCKRQEQPSHLEHEIGQIWPKWVIWLHL